MHPQFARQWARRQRNDKHEQLTGHVSKTILHELTGDPTGVGFGFGGVTPGVLHARGQLHEVHKVTYSVGLSGEYLLHVRLRQQAVAIPGSPFHLNVRPGPAHAKSTHLSSQPLRGMVGHAADSGCQLTVRTADKMGNMCISGGEPAAKVAIICDYNAMETKVENNGDGTFLLDWKSKYSGSFKTRVTIDGLDVIGSPREFSLTSCNPELSKSEVSGEGLKSATAGKLTRFSISFVDNYGNTAIPGSSFKFGMAFNFKEKEKEKEKLMNLKPHDFEGEWEAGDTGIYEMRYTAKAAGWCDLHVWCDPTNKGERLPFPNSPYHLSVAPGRASPAVSSLPAEGWTKVVKEERGGGKGAAGHDASALYAGDTICIRPQIYDQYENATVLPEDALKIVHKRPNGSEHQLHYTQSQKSGQWVFDIRHDTAVSGAHSVDVLLFDTPIRGSPVTFTVQPDKPDPTNCKMLSPEGVSNFYTGQMYTCRIKTFDRFNNECRTGGLTLSFRLQVIKQGVHDQTTLVPSNHSCEVVDEQNGEYAVNVSVAIPCVIKVIVNMDKNLPASGGELTPVQLQFLQNPDSAPKDATGGSPGGASSGGPVKGKGSTKLKAAVNEVMQGFGAPEERREKDALVVAAEAFADGSSSFEFDKNDSPAVAATLPASPVMEVSIAPNKDLFDRTAPGPAPTKARKGGSLKKVFVEAPAV